ncbi:hypothetical protein F4781DRAFT_215330 [Annulohypoxylon bovei var. microspora]|nr:hypothetical protein F4781DRAFT_215330 [Annulohypoxylon bovei var. microspora]
MLIVLRYHLQSYYPEEKTVTVCLDLHGFFYLIRWARRIVGGDRIDAIINCKDTPSYRFDRDIYNLLAPGYNDQAMKTSRKCKESGICSNRLWNLSILSALGPGDIPYIAQIALNMKKPSQQRNNSNHENCTEQMCIYSDVNSTSVKQMHKCGYPHNCGNIEFPTIILDEAFNPRGADKWHQTAWVVPRKASYSLRQLKILSSLRNLKHLKMSSLCSPDKHKYIAISVSKKLLTCRWY